MLYKVIVVETATGKVVKEFAPTSILRAERVQSGVSINMDHDKFHADIVEAEPSLVDKEIAKGW